MPGSEDAERDLAGLAVPQRGALITTGDRLEPFRLVDAAGAVVGAVVGVVVPPPVQAPLSVHGLPSPVFRSGWSPCVHHLAVYL